MPSTVAEQAGCNLTHSEAFPFQREIASRWNRWRVVSGGGIPRRCPWSRPMLLNVLDGLFTPASQRFHDKGDESDTSNPASPSMGDHLPLLPHSQSISRSGGSSS